MAVQPHLALAVASSADATTSPGDSMASPGGVMPGSASAVSLARRRCWPYLVTPPSFLAAPRPGSPRTRGGARVHPSRPRDRPCLPADRRWTCCVRRAERGGPAATLTDEVLVDALQRPRPPRSLLSLAAPMPTATPRPCLVAPKPLPPTTRSLPKGASGLSQPQCLVQRSYGLVLRG